MANPYKNEVEITLGERKYTLTPTFKCIAETENAIGKSFSELLFQAHTFQFLASHLFIILKNGILAHGDQVNDEELEEAMVQEGLSRVADYCVQFMIAAQSGSKYAKKK